MDTLENEKTYDSVFWTSVVKLTRFFIPLVNEAFGEQFTDETKITLEPMKQSMQMSDDSFERGEMDAIAMLTDGGVTKEYHVEIETNTDKAFAIRIAEYAAGKAYDSVTLTEKGARMTIPYSTVIYLKASGGVPNEYIIEIDYPGGTVSYRAPVMKIKNYSIDALFEKRLLLLLPFFGFIYESKFPEMEKSGINELKADLDDINSRLVNMVRDGQIDESQRCHLIDWIKRVLDKMTIRYQNVAKGVDEIMGGYILHTRTDDILDEGIDIGRSQRDREKIAVMLRNGLNPQEVANYGDYPIELVEEVEQSMLVTA